MREDENFDDIRPYNDLEVQDVLKRIARNEWIVSGLRRMLLPNCPRLLERIADWIIENYLSIRALGLTSIDEFQRKVVVGTVLEWLVHSTTDGLSYTGFEPLERRKSYIYLSNHRDIVLDSALLNYALVHNSKNIAAIAFGDNLLINPLVSDLIRVNKSFIVRRNLPIREQIKASYHLSHYIWHLHDRNIAMWIAQREGRAKDGDDRTNPAVLKMLYLSQRRGGLSFSDFIEQIGIVPTALSYEFDPCDIMKAREEYIKSRAGTYHKKKRDDLMSMYAGLKDYKGRVHVSVGTPLSGFFENEKKVAEEIDRSIHRIYKLWPSNFLSYDIAHECETFRDRYTDDYKQRFLARFDQVAEGVKAKAIEMYARAVENRLFVDSGSI